MNERARLGLEIAEKRRELYRFYQYLYFDEIDAGRTRFELFSNDQIDLLDDHEEYLMVVMDTEELERELSSKQQYLNDRIRRIFTDKE